MKHYQSRIQDFMTAQPLVISPNTTLSAAYTLMFDNEIRRLPVVEAEELVGIITLSDIQRAISPLFEGELDVATRLELVDRKVRTVMAWEPVTVGPEDTIREAAALMLENKVSGLPVVQDNHVVGIITESDIFKLVIDA
ncbi:MAG: CBS domain-containing protein [Chloroflexi bacterium]|nr:CBS domain-containing protein [Chloroflexota bacterium]